MSNRVTDIPGLMHLWVWDKLYLAGQPQLPESWEHLKAQGVTKVINIRSEGEADFDGDREKAESLEMDYVHIPVLGAAGLDGDACRKISAEIKKETSTLIHCGTANRVAGWLITYLVDSGMEFEQAVKIASENGLSNPGFIQQAEDILNS